MDPQQILENRDYYLIVDKSGSMSDTDTRNGKSRWLYARENTEALAREITKFDPDGINVYTFSSQFKEYKNVTAEKVKDIWQEQNPGGSTVLAPVLQHCFNDYLQNKKNNSAKANGAMVIVVTDGQPEDESEVMKSIVNFGNRLENADSEFGISFLQVGKDSGASAFLKRLDDELVTKYGAKHDIVDAKSMDEVDEIGFIGALIAGLND